MTANNVGPLYIKILNMVYRKPLSWNRSQSPFSFRCHLSSRQGNPSLVPSSQTFSENPKLCSSTCLSKRGFDADWIGRANIVWYAFYASMYYVCSKSLFSLSLFSVIRSIRNVKQSLNEVSEELDNFSFISTKIKTCLFVYPTLRSLKQINSIRYNPVVGNSFSIVGHFRDKLGIHRTGYLPNNHQVFEIKRAFRKCKI